MFTQLQDVWVFWQKSNFHLPRPWKTSVGQKMQIKKNQNYTFSQNFTIQQKLKKDTRFNFLDCEKNENCATCIFSIPPDRWNHMQVNHLGLVIQRPLVSSLHISQFLSFRSVTNIPQCKGQRCFWASQLPRNLLGFRSTPCSENTERANSNICPNTNHPATHVFCSLFAHTHAQVDTATPVLHCSASS